MTKSDQIKILNNKIKANNAQYDINRLNAYSTLGKVFNDGLNKNDKIKKVGILQRLKNIEDNLNSNDDDNDNDNGKVGIFQIIKDIKDKGIKISNDDEAIRKIREHIQSLKIRVLELIILMK